MTRPPLPFYRSEVTRWSFIISGSFMAWALSPWGPAPWHDTPSLRWLHQLLPWAVLSAGFVVYVVLLLRGSVTTTEVADWLGLFFYGCGLFALLVTIRIDRPTNPFAIGGVFLACVLHFAAARLVTHQAAKERV